MKSIREIALVVLCMAFLLSPASAKQKAESASLSGAVQEVKAATLEESNIEKPKKKKTTKAKKSKKTKKMSNSN